MPNERTYDEGIEEKRSNAAVWHRPLGREETRDAQKWAYRQPIGTSALDADKKGTGGP